MPKFGPSFLAIVLAVFPNLLFAQDAPPPSPLSGPMPTSGPMPISRPMPISGPMPIENSDVNAENQIIIDSGGSLKSVDSDSEPGPMVITLPNQPGTGAELPQNQAAKSNLPPGPPPAQMRPPGQIPPQRPVSNPPPNLPQQLQTTAPMNATSSGMMGR